MTSITKEAIKSRAEKLWQITDALHPLRKNGFRLNDGGSYDYSSQQYVLGKKDYWLEYSDDDGSHWIHFHALNGEVSDLVGYSRDGDNLVETNDETLKNALNAFGNDRLLYEIFKQSELHYDGKIRVTIDTCISPMDTERMQDGYYTETTYTLNRKCQVFESKPKPYTRSVLVALNID